MVILLAPPRSGSTAATNILKSLHPNIIKAHYVKYDNTDPDNKKLIFDNGLNIPPVSPQDISIMYYQWRPSLECCVSFALYNKYQEIQTASVYSNWLNSSEGIYWIFDSLQKYWQFGALPFAISDVSNKLVLNYSYMTTDSAKYSASFPDYVLSKSKTSRKQFDEFVSKTLKVTAKQKLTDPGDARLLSFNNITPQALLSAETLMILRWLCSNTCANKTTKEIDALFKARGVKFEPMEIP